MKSPTHTAEELLEQLTVCAKRNDRQELACLEALLATIPPSAYAALDVALRSRSYSWPLITPRDVTTSIFHKVHWAVAAVSASHPSGHVRQAAIRTLAQCRVGRALSPIIARLNDWVPEVRRAAETALANFASPEYAVDITHVLPMVLALSRQQRVGQMVVASWLLRTLQTDACRSALIGSFIHESKDMRLACFETAIKAGSTGLQIEALETALRDREPSVRAWAVRRLQSALPPERALELARVALRDRSVQVRRSVLPILFALVSREEGVTVSEAALLEESSANRWLARRLRLSLGPFDLAKFYREQVATASTNPLLRAALGGLGESGKQEDIALVQPFLGKGTLSVRAAALGAIASLQDLQSAVPFTEALMSSETALSHASCNRPPRKSPIRNEPFRQWEKSKESMRLPRSRTS